MNEKEVKKTILTLLKKIAPDTNPNELNPDDNISAELDIDSFDYLNFIVGLDEEFGIKTPEEDYGKIRTLKELILYINKKSAVDPDR